MYETILNALSAFALYFLVAAVLLAAFLVVYAALTPYSELALIRQGNVAASVSLAGTMIGIAMPVAVAVVASHNLTSMLGWGLVACTVQLLVFVVARIVIPQITQDIPADRLAPAIFLAALSIGVGIVNSACIL